MKDRLTGAFAGPIVRRRGWHVGVPYQAIGALVALAEAVMIVVGSAFGPVVYGWVSGTNPSTPFGAGVLASLLYVSVARSTGLYRLPTLIDPGRQLGRIAVACGFVLLSITAVLFLLKIGSTVSRGAVSGFAALMLGLCVLTRLGAADIVKALMATDGVLGRRAFLIGETDELASLTPATLLRQFGLREVGRLALDGANGCDSLRERRRIEDAVDMARLSNAKEFVLAAKFDRLEPLTVMEEALRRSPLPVRLLPNRVFRSVIDRHTLGQDASLHLIELRRAPLGLAERFIKRCMDVVGATLALVVLAPLLLLTVCAIRLESAGPIIFRQRRSGFDQREFVIFKFRTMTVLDDDASVVQARREDRRVTRVGRILRRSSIDELPQLVNVILGEMSLVGPRPHAVAHDDRFKALIGQYCMRHHVKPGITGWAQVNGLRGETARTEQMKHRIESDLWYIDNWSLTLDVRILLRTCFAVLKQDAY